jgi:hypothetical protein
VKVVSVARIVASERVPQLNGTFVGFQDRSDRRSRAFESDTFRMLGVTTPLAGEVGLHR